MVADPLVQKAQDIIRPLLRKHDRMFLFGSRTAPVHHPYSDIDIGIKGSNKVPMHIIATINDILEESDLPVRVDVVDFSRISSDFAAIAKQSIQPL